MTDIIDYARGLADLTIPGVRHDFGLERPQSVKAAQLPAKYVQAGNVSREPFVLDVSGADSHGVARRTMTLQIVILVSSMTLGRTEPNVVQTLEMCDAVTKEVTKADVALSWPIVEVEVGEVSLAGGAESYWGLVATVSATG